MRDEKYLSCYARRVTGSDRGQVPRTGTTPHFCNPFHFPQHDISNWKEERYLIRGQIYRYFGNLILVHIVKMSLYDLFDELRKMTFSSSAKLMKWRLF